MVRFALDLHLLDRNGNDTGTFVTIKGDSLYEIFKNIDFNPNEVEYARVWYLTQSLDDLEKHGDGWWNWVKLWYLTPDKIQSLMRETVYA